MKRRIIIFGLASLLILSALGLYVLIPGSSAEIENTADSFKAEPYWELTNRSVEPAYRVCLGGNRCPSVRKDWQTDQIVSKESLQTMLRSNDWNMDIDGTCEPRQNVKGEGPVCSVSGQIDNYDIRIYLSKDKDTTRSTLQLFVNPHVELY